DVGDPNVGEEVEDQQSEYDQHSRDPDPQRNFHERYSGKRMTIYRRSLPLAQRLRVCREPTVPELRRLGLLVLTIPSSGNTPLHASESVAESQGAGNGRAAC